MPKKIGYETSDDKFNSGWLRPQDENYDFDDNDNLVQTFENEEIEKPDEPTPFDFESKWITKLADAFDGITQMYADGYIDILGNMSMTNFVDYMVAHCDSDKF